MSIEARSAIIKAQDVRIGPVIKIGMPAQFTKVSCVIKPEQIVKSAIVEPLAEIKQLPEVESFQAKPESVVAEDTFPLAVIKEPEIMRTLKRIPEERIAEQPKQPKVPTYADRLRGIWAYRKIMQQHEKTQDVIEAEWKEKNMGWVYQIWYWLISKLWPKEKYKLIYVRIPSG